MGARHVDELFSLAYDDALDPAQRTRYEEHLADCPQCASAAEDFRRGVDAVRALPAARMPVRVVLPATPPAPERRGMWWLPRVPSLGPAWGGGALALAGIAAVVVAVHAHGGGTAGGGSAGNTAALRAPVGQNAAGVGGPASKAAGGAASAVRGCTRPTLATAAPQGFSFNISGGPAGFANRVTVSNPQRPGQELVLATTSARYAPGSQVLVFAALASSSGGRTAVIPCVVLRAQPVALSGGGEGAGQSPVPAQGAANGADTAVSPGFSTDLGFAPPLAVAVPTAQSVERTLPVQVLTIPRGLAPGTVLELVAVIPGGVPGSGDTSAIEADLTVVVS